ncbi:flavodoxin domain-containing protein [Peribacillus psychrosaccharolyticus]|uniref:flavodoxin domain-containing protein n=1 Tax=Peribacillus psychrosaccharolyticus TaxID=1407 RepID=UPI003D2BE03F
MIAIVYHSAGGNTKAIAEAIASFLPDSQLYRVSEVDSSALSAFDGLIVGTYTWGNGELPAKMVAFYRELETLDLTQTVTAVFGTGETNYQHFCGAVDIFRDMLFAKSRLAVTLKIEQMYQETDYVKINRFASLFRAKLSNSQEHTLS